MKKKGQITIFIIIGLILLASILLFLYFRSATKSQELIQETRSHPLSIYIETCIDNAVRDGINTIGLTGGYIDFPEEIERNPFSNLQRSPLKQDKMPYWWYNGINAIPDKQFILNQLSQHISKQLKDCVGDFKQFEDFEVKELGPVDAKASLARNDVVVDVKYPLLVTNKMNQSKTNLEFFRTTIPIRLNRVYELAKTIMEHENRDDFLEQKTIDLIALDNDIPLANVEITCNKKIWSFDKVKNKLKTLLRTNLPYIRIRGTDYEDSIYVPNPWEDQNTFNSSYYNYHYIWDVNGELDDLHVTFYYDEKWPMRFNVRPSNGKILESNAQKGQELLSLFCLHIWHFTYDTVYPVIVTIHDEGTKDHEAYTFSFAFQVSVNHNQPYRYNFADENFEGSDIVAQEEYCSDLYNEITIWTEENSSEEQTPMSDVNLSLTCGRYTCNLGSSGWLGYGAGTGITKQVPYCVNAILKGKKEGYEDAETFIQTDQPNSYTLYMTPTALLSDYMVVKHPEGNPNTEEFLEPGEKAAIILRANGFESYGLYPTTSEYPLKFLAKQDNSYSLQIYVTKEQENGEQLIGGYIGNWTVSWDELKEANRIKFHVIETDSTDEDEVYMFMGALEDLSKTIPEPDLR